jgi:hypothetical protein
MQLSIKTFGAEASIEDLVHTVPPRAARLDKAVPDADLLLPRL